MSPHDLLASPLPLLLLLLTLGYVGAVVAWPFANCRRCSGTGKSRSWFSGKTHRICRRCVGTGRRLRPARKAYNHLSARRREARSTTRGTTGGTTRSTAREAARATERNAR